MIKRYLWRSGWGSTVQGLRHIWTLQEKHSFTHSFFPAAQLFPPRVGCLVVCCVVGCCVVVMLLLLFSFTLLLRCQHHRRHHCWHAAAAATTVGPHGGWCLLHECRQHPHHVVANWATEKIRNKNTPWTMALGGRQAQIKMQEPTNNMRAWRGRDETWGATGGERKGSAIWLFSGNQVGT